VIVKGTATYCISSFDWIHSHSTYHLLWLQHYLLLCFLFFVSANSVFLTPALIMLWRYIQITDAITPADRQLVQFNDVGKTKEQKEELIEQQFKRNSRLHGTLSKILHLVPKGHSEMFPVIASSFPFKLAPLQRQACYANQCFTVLRYVPTIR